MRKLLMAVAAAGTLVAAVPASAQVYLGADPGGAGDLSQPQAGVRDTVLRQRKQFSPRRPRRIPVARHVVDRADLDGDVGGYRVVTLGDRRQFQDDPVGFPLDRACFGRDQDDRNLASRQEVCGRTAFAYQPGVRQDSRLAVGHEHVQPRFELGTDGKKRAGTVRP